MNVSTRLINRPRSSPAPIEHTCFTWQLPTAPSETLTGPVWWRTVGFPELRRKAGVDSYPKQGATCFAPCDSPRHAQLTRLCFSPSHVTRVCFLARTFLVCSAVQRAHTIATRAVDPNESYSAWVTAPRASPPRLCRTQIEPAWWITQWLMMDYKAGLGSAITESDFTTVLWSPTARWDVS